MNIRRMISKKFSFLKRKGFRQKVYSRNGDLEIHYSSENSRVEFYYYLSTLTKYCIDVIIESNGKRSRISNSIDKSQNSLSETLDAFKEFIEKNT